MSKKQIFKIGILAVFIALIMYVVIGFAPIKQESGTVAFDITSDSAESDIIQIYYLLDEADDFTEENSESFILEAGKTTSVEFDVSNLYGFRIDYGTRNGTIHVENLKFSMGMFSERWTENDWNAKVGIVGIQETKFENGSAEVYSISEDPYMIWHIDDFQLSSRFANQINVINIVCKLIVGFALFIFMLVFLKKFDFFVEFPKEIWQSKGIIFQLAKNDFKSRFAGSYLGIVWAFVQPIVTVFVYWFVFEKGLRSGAMLNVPFVLWLMAGIVPWFFFSDALNGGTNALIEYQYLVKKVVFQISILPLVKVISNFWVHLVFVVFTLVLFVLNGFMPDLYTLQIVYYSFCTFMFVLGLCYFTSALVGFFRDLSQIIGIVLQVGVWITPIMWNIETMDVPMWIKNILQLNPLYYVVAGYRDALINKVWFWQNMDLTIYFWMITIGMLGMGMFTFKKLKIHFADVL